MEFIKDCLYNKNDNELLIKQLNKKYDIKQINNIINSFIKYPEYNKYEIDVKKYNECCKYFINILFYKNRDLIINDFITFNNFKVNNIILCQNYKDISYLFEILLYAIIIKNEGYININYQIPLYDNIPQENELIIKKKLINRNYQLKTHSFQGDNFFVVFQCYVISAINMIIQNKEMGDEIIINEFSETLTAENFYKGGSLEMINAFQKCLNTTNGKCLKIIKYYLNKLTNNKYLFGLSPFKIYPHILVNDLLKCLSPINFTNDCKIIFNNNKYSFIYNLNKNLLYYDDILNKKVNDINLISFNLYDELINDINFNNIINYPKHFFIATTLYDPNIYKIFSFTNDIYNNKTNILINNYNIINTFQLNFTLYKYVFIPYKYQLNKFIVFDTIKSHFYLIKIKNNKLFKFDNNVFEINKLNINQSYKKIVFIVMIIIFMII